MADYTNYENTDYPIFSFESEDNTRVLILIDEENCLYHKRIESNGSSKGWKSADRDLIRNLLRNDARIGQVHSAGGSKATINEEFPLMVHRNGPVVFMDGCVSLDGTTNDTYSFIIPNGFSNTSKSVFTVEDDITPNHFVKIESQGNSVTIKNSTGGELVWFSGILWNTNDNI